MVSTVSPCSQALDTRRSGLPGLTSLIGGLRAVHQHVIGAGGALGMFDRERRRCVPLGVEVDQQHKVVTTPAYMLGPTIAPVSAGIDKLVGAVLECHEHAPGQAADAWRIGVGPGEAQLVMQVTQLTRGAQWRAGDQSGPAGDAHRGPPVAG